MRKRWKRLPSKVDPDDLFSNSTIDSSIFLTYLHHNYPQYTYSSSSSSSSSSTDSDSNRGGSIESCVEIVDSLSYVDSNYQYEAAGGGGGLTSLYSFSVAVRSTLLGLPSPVERRQQVLRKSEWWEIEKLKNQNRQGLDDLLQQQDDGDDSDNDVSSLIGLSSSSKSSIRDKKTLLTEFIPWFNLIKTQSTTSKRVPFYIYLLYLSSYTNSVTRETDLPLPLASSV